MLLSAVHYLLSSIFYSPSSILYSSPLRHRAHLLEANGGDLKRITGPQVFAEQFQRQPAVVADLSQQGQLACEIEMPVTGIDAVFVVLFFARREQRRVVKMHDGDLLSLQFRERLERSAAPKDVERVA